ncbi:hypothetical protein B0J13DRAFT_566847 [Dactylonectria estremocensis]|uniref:FAD-binding domain-containing protein n=1 Tax=Dactylonectria estremocensis TaxID=1079267 RepID=A0A9P9DNA9_9HYPO|nr:hypothetical protein B0J13DRAFT_566847 [Dactylonectria estremocensis]
MATGNPSSAEQPVLIIGAGISGLLLAQRLHQDGVPFRLFERDADLKTRGAGWGLTLHWSLPALRSLLPDHLAQRLPEAYVDRAAVAEGASSSFPFFDLSTGELKAATPKASEAQRIRVTREALRHLLATDINIEWEKSLADATFGPTSATATFEDGSSMTGRLIIACDGAQSRVRRLIFPGQWETYKLPVRMLGVKLQLSPEQMKSVHDLDRFFLQGTASSNDSFVYISVLDAPGNNAASSDKYVCQMCVSWPYRDAFFNKPSPTEIPETNEEKRQFIETIAKTWAEPFRTLAHSIPPNEEIKHLTPQDFAPPPDLRTTGRALLMGDALHAMAMYRGEGANHAIVDVQDFVERVVPVLKENQPLNILRGALDAYEDEVIKRARPGVLASRRACLDAHEWSRINNRSPLLTRRERNTQFMEDS